MGGSSAEVVIGEAMLVEVGIIGDSVMLVGGAELGVEAVEVVVVIILLPKRGNFQLEGVNGDEVVEVDVVVICAVDGATSVVTTLVVDGRTDEGGASVSDEMERSGKEGTDGAVHA